jgi:hypothetical protein
LVGDFPGLVGLLLMCSGRDLTTVEESEVQFMSLEVDHESPRKCRAGCAVTAVRTGGVVPAVLKPPADLRRMSRCFMAVLLPVGPAAVAVQRFVLPYRTTDGPEAVVAKVAADPRAQSLLLWLALVGLFTLVPGVLGVARLTRCRAPRTTATAVLLLVPAYLSMGWLVGSDVLLWVGVRAGVDQSTLVRLYGTDHPTTMVAAAVFVLGHVVGTVVLGFALWRSGAVPRWAAVLTLVAQPLHFTAAVLLGSPALDLAAWGLNAAGFAAAALAILRLPDDAWDVAPAAPTAAGRAALEPTRILRR